ncbi:MAG: EamA family transporter [Candidatus Pacebacteria bacterium]|nr:EamA family transporter [Candidatus Paceibacterota bacterium]
MIIQVILALIVSFLIVGGQVIWKIILEGQTYNFAIITKLLKSPLFIVGIIMYLIAAIIWLYMLSKYQYHQTYPLLSISFILSLLASSLILHESVSWMSWLGVFFICLGIIIMGFGFKSF